MAKTLKLTFDTDEATRTLMVTNPKADVSHDECEAAMQEIVDSGAFDGIIGAKKAVMVESTSEIIYEA